MGNFELDLTSHLLLYNYIITVVSTAILFYQMCGRRFILIFLPPGFNIGRSTNTPMLLLVVILYVTHNTAFENESRFLRPKK